MTENGGPGGGAGWLSVDDVADGLWGWFAVLCLLPDGTGVTDAAVLRTPDGWGLRHTVFARSPDTFATRELAEAYAARHRPW